MLLIFGANAMRGECDSPIQFEGIFYAFDLRGECNFGANAVWANAMRGECDAGEYGLGEFKLGEFDSPLQCGIRNHWDDFH